MDHDEFREAVEWATELPGELPESPLLTGIQHDRNIEEGNAYDSGVELQYWQTLFSLHVFRDSRDSGISIIALISFSLSIPWHNFIGLGVSRQI